MASRILCYRNKSNIIDILRKTRIICGNKSCSYSGIMIGEDKNENL